MKLYIDCDEFYPFYALQERPWWSGSKVIELTDEEYRDYQAITDKFEAWQDKLNDLYPKDPPRKKYTEADFAAQALAQCKKMYP